MKIEMKNDEIKVKAEKFFLLKPYKKNDKYVTFNVQWRN